MPNVSIVIPVHNEEEVLESALARLIREFSEIESDFEVLVIENGSTDRTYELLTEIAEKEPRIRAYKSPVPDYGRALKMGLVVAEGKKVISDEIDVLDTGFHRGAIEALENNDLIIASKRHPSAVDDRGFYRRLGTDVITTLLKLGCGLKSTDTHGPKAWRREIVRSLVPATVLDGDLFASEVVIRAERLRLRICELPLSITETRSSAIPLVKRVPKVLRDLQNLRRALKLTLPLPDGEVGSFDADIPYISIVIPAHNEAERIHLAIDGFAAEFKKRESEWLEPGKIEMLIVSDGSTDGTEEIAKNLLENNGLSGRVIALSPSRGKGGALAAGFMAATGKYAFFSDADLAAPADSLWPMLAELEQGADAVIGTRRQDASDIQKGQGTLRQFLGHCFTNLTNMMLETDFSDFTCGFKGYKTTVARDLYSRLTINGWAYDAEILFLAARADYKTQEVPVVWADVDGSKVNPAAEVFRCFRDLVIIRSRWSRGVYKK
ncbi:MAG: glycosyltransferase [Candidatus Lindowbacteria bacterium]|nr:glycosyltransferase [Candidatus Lindowbacteria bacterium]